MSRRSPVRHARSERRYPLAAVADAHRRIEGGHERGNLVFEMLGGAECDAGVGVAS